MTSDSPLRPKVLVAYADECEDDGQKFSSSTPVGKISKVLVAYADDFEKVLVAYAVTETSKVLLVYAVVLLQFGLTKLMEVDASLRFRFVALQHL